MKSKGTSLQRIQLLSSLCQEKPNFNVKLASLTLSRLRFPSWFNILILFVEYVQLISQMLLLNSYKSTSTETISGQIFGSISSIGKVFSPGHLLAYSGNLVFTKCILFFLVIFTCLKYVLFIYISLIALSKTQKISVLLVNIWQFTVRVQGRCLYYLVTCIWLYAVMNNDNNILGFSGPYFKGKFIALTAVMVVLEFALSVVLLLRCACLLPTRDLLASKSIRLETMTLLQKFVLQMLELTVRSARIDTPVWVLNLISLVFCLVQVLYFFQAFPLYSVRMLKYQASLLVTVAAVNFAYLLHSLIRASNKHLIDDNFAIVVWLMITPFIIKGTHALINAQILKLCSKGMDASPELLVHKIGIIKHFLKKHETPSLEPRKWKHNFLVGTNILVDVREILDLPLEKKGNNGKDDNTSVKSEKAIDKLMILYLENLMNKFPKNKLIRLILGVTYANKNNEIYGKAMKILMELKKNAGYSVALSAALSIEKIQDTIDNKYRSGESILDLSTYTRSISLVAQLKLKMLGQTELQIGLCDDINHQFPDLSKIYSQAQRINRHRTDIKKMITKITTTVPEYYLEPLVLAGHYHLALNYSMENYLKYSQLVTRRTQKYEKIFESDKLCEETLYHKSTGLMVMSGEQGKAGILLYSSKTTNKLVGKDCTNLTMRAFVPPSSQDYFSQLIKSLLESGEKTFLDRINFNLNYNNKSLNVFPANSYLNIHPFLDQDVMYIAFIREIITAKQYIVISEDGNIENFTRDIGQKLNLPLGSAYKTEINISQLSRELAKLSKAFNMIALPEKYDSKGEIRSYDTTTLRTLNRSKTSGLFENKSDEILRERKSTFTRRDLATSIDMNAVSAEKAKELYNLYTTEGKELRLFPIDENKNVTTSQGLKYLCKASYKFIGKSLLKIIALEEAQSSQYSVETPLSPTRRRNNFEKKRTIISPARGSQRSLGRENPRLAQTQEELFNPVTINIEEPSFERFDTGHEKELGWVDFGKLNTEGALSELKRRESRMRSLRIASPRGVGERLISDYDALLSAKNLITTEEGLRTDRTEQNSRNIFGQALRSDESGIGNKNFVSFRLKEDEEEEEEEKKENIVIESPEKRVFVEVDRLEGSRKTSFMSAGSQMKLSKIYENAVKTKYYPTFFRTFLYFLYTTFIIIFILQLVFSSQTTSNISSLKIIKDAGNRIQESNIVLSMLQSEAGYLVSTLGGATSGPPSGGLPTLPNGPPSGSPSGSTGSGPASSSLSPFQIIAMFADLTTGTLGNLTKINKEIITLSGNLSKEAQGKVFERDVEYYENGDETTVTVFQATDLVVSMGSEALTYLPNMLGNITVIIMKQALNNSMNDIVLKKFMINQLFADALVDKKDELLARLNRNLFVMIGLFVLLMLVFGVVVYTQYKRLRDHMTTYIRMNKKGIRHLLDSFSRFKHKVLSDDPFDGIKETFRSETIPSEYYQSLDNITTNTDDSKVPNPSGLNKKYGWYAVELFVILTILICSAIVNAKIEKTAVNKALDQFSQQSYLKKLQFMINFDASMAMDYVNQNASTITLNKPIKNVFKAYLDETSAMVTNLSKVIPQSSSENADIQDIMFSDACAHIGPLVLDICERVEAGRDRISFIEFANQMATTLTSFYTQYEQSNKTAAELATIASGFENVMFPSLPLNDIFLTLSGLFDDEISKTFDDVSEGNRFGATFTICFFLFGCVVIHFWVVGRIREADNQFRKALQALPADIVLSNFVLKMYLIRTSNGALDRYKI